MNELLTITDIFHIFTPDPLAEFKGAYF